MKKVLGFKRGVPIFEGDSEEVVPLAWEEMNRAKRRNVIRKSDRATRLAHGFGKVNR